MHKFLLNPAVVFIIIFVFLWFLSSVLSGLSFRSKEKKGGRDESYACGEDTYNNMAQPDYTNFFAFAFFFTLAHVATLIMTTAPVENLRVFALAVFYIVGAGLGLSILLRD